MRDEEEQEDAGYDEEAEFRPTEDELYERRRRRCEISGEYNSDIESD